MPDNTNDGASEDILPLPSESDTQNMSLASIQMSLLQVRQFLRNQRSLYLALRQEVTDKHTQNRKDYHNLANKMQTFQDQLHNAVAKMNDSESQLRDLASKVNTIERRLTSLVGEDGRSGMVYEIRESLSKINENMQTLLLAKAHSEGVDAGAKEKEKKLVDWGKLVITGGWAVFVFAATMLAVYLTKKMGNVMRSQVQIEVRPLTDPVVMRQVQTLSTELTTTFRAYKNQVITLERLQNNLGDFLGTHLDNIIEYGYISGCKVVGVTPDVSQKYILKRHAKSHALEVAKELTRVTHNAFDFSGALSAAMSQKRASSKARGTGIAQAQASRIFFMGSRKGWSSKRNSTRRLKKHWLTSSGNPCEICLDNEDAGGIDIDDTFPSGDFEPPGHPLGCECYLGLYW